MTSTGDRRPTTVGELMSSDPIVVGASTKLTEAARIMEENAVSGLPVVAADGGLIGVLSETDLVRIRATEHLWQRWPGLAVRHVMHTPVVTAHRHTTATEAAALMEAAHVHRLVVVDAADGHPIGVLSTSDLVRHIAQESPDG